MSDQRLFDSTLAHALGYLAALSEAPVSSSASLPELRERFLGPVPEHSTDPAEVVDEVVRIAEDGLIRSGSGQRCVRVSVCNWRTTGEDVDLTVDAVRRCLEQTPLREQD